MNVGRLCQESRASFADAGFQSAVMRGQTIDKHSNHSPTIEAAVTVV